MPASTRIKHVLGRHVTWPSLLYAPILIAKLRLPMPTAADTGSGVCNTTEPSERRIAYIASLLIVKHRAVLTLSLKHRKLKHNLLKTGHFLSELILFILDSI